MSFGRELCAAEDKHNRPGGTEHECHEESRCTRVIRVQKCSLFVGVHDGYFLCFVMLVDLQCLSHLFYCGIHDAYTDCGCARNSMHARDLEKPDESMNPYESTMNPIQKTDESMNPLLLYRKEKEVVCFHQI